MSQLQFQWVSAHFASMKFILHIFIFFLTLTCLYKIHIQIY